MFVERHVELVRIGAGAEVARIMGHSREKSLRTYLHEMDEIASQGPVDGDELILEARELLVASV